MIKDVLEKSIREAFVSLSLPDKGFVLEHPEKMENGDYSTSAALAYASAAQTTPRELAEKIKTEIEKDLPSEIEKIEIAGPGFINFFLKRSFFAQSVAHILKQGEQFGRNQKLEGKKIMVEYTDPNPFKEFHIGHLMSNAIGESLSRLIEWSGANTIRACYQGDVGLHVAKAMWAILKNKNDFPDENIPLVMRIAYISSCYVEGSKAYEEDEDAKKEIAEINKKIFEKTDADINKFYELGRTWTLEHFEEIYKKLGTKFDYYFFESDMAPIGKSLVEEYLANGVFKESNGAVIFPGEKFGLHTRVFINSQGIPTYEAKDLGLNTTKFKKEDLDQSIIITANEQDDYFKVVLESLRHIDEKVALRTMHISHGMLRFASGKMSSRKGNIITGESLLNDSENSIRQKITERDYSAELKDEIAQRVGVAAIKYSILKQAIGADIIYDEEKSISFDGDSGPYIQYTFVRTQSILEKAKDAGITPEWNSVPSNAEEIEKMIYKFPEIVDRARNDYAPQYIATYLIEVSRAFNAYYGNTRIIDNDEFSPYRVALTKAVSIVIKNGLYLLGINVPEKM